MTDMAIVTGRDFTEVTDALGPDELQFLLHNLDINQRDIEVFGKAADTTDPRLKARAVLCHWKSTRGRAATRGALFEAKRKAILQGEKTPSSLGN